MGIREFYRGKEIFITGGSGFIGKLLIEKLLRSCPDVGTIYLLLRPKRGKSSQSRLQEYLSDCTFDRVRKEQPQNLVKLAAIEGDCSQLGLGISAEDLKLMQNVSLIFHAAASVRFDDPLRDAILLNTRGTLEIVKIAENLKNLKAFVHVSTTYCNPDKDVVEERVYPPYDDWRKAIKLAETVDQQTLNILESKYIHNQPNSYTFTKGLAEQIVNEFKERIPSVIFRPSVVIVSYREPEPGWIDNFNGPLGLTVAVGFGLVSAVYANNDTGIDMIPVDIVVRALILTGYRRAGGHINSNSSTDDEETQLVAWQQVQKPEDSVEVVNCAAGKYHRISNLEYSRSGTDTAYQNPFRFAIWTPTARNTNCFFMYWLQIMSMDLTRGFILDIVMRLLKKKPIVTAAVRRLYITNVMLHFFSNRSFDFKVKNCLSLNDVLRNKEEINEFGLGDLTTYNLRILFSNAVCTIKKLKFNEKPYADQSVKLRVQGYWLITKLMQFYGIWLLCQLAYSVLINKYNNLSQLMQM